MTLYEDEQSEVPDWFTQVDFDAVAAKLNEHLQTLLAESTLSGALGEVLAQRLSVSKLDNLHEGGTPEAQYDAGDDELSAITAELSEQLQVILMRDYDAPESDVAFAVVRRWDALVAAANQCHWTSKWIAGRWCAIKVCC